ncbi:MAG: hypothetical protein JW888_15450 [Pirellulales bacterium]|nr:hypothetical protein [Pirellulales bacterium]
MIDQSARRGYAMLLVVVFIALVNLFLVLSYKQLATAIRIETLRRTTEQHDQTIEALAAGVALLETGTPTESPSTYAFPAAPAVSTTDITFEYQEDHAEGGEIWLVTATPSAVPAANDLPETFSPPPPPPPP